MPLDELRLLCSVTDTFNPKKVKFSKDCPFEIFDMFPLEEFCSLVFSQIKAFQLNFLFVSQSRKGRGA